MQDGNNAPENFLRSLAGQLINAYGLEYHIPTDLYEINQVFKKILTELSQHGQPLIIVVDALDEADQFRYTHTILHYLPAVLPAHIYFIVTSRPQLKLSLQAETVYEEYFLPSLGVEELEAYLQKRGQQPELAERLHEVSQGNPLYLYYLLQPGETLTEGALDHVPQGLHEFYSRNWELFVIHEQNVALLEARTLLLGLLALLRSPVPRKELIKLAKMKTAVL